MKTRKSSRAVILNARGEIFLFRFELAMLKDSKTLWITPGGGQEDGETPLQALKRELYEEIGMTVCGEPPVVFHRVLELAYQDGTPFLSDESYFFIRVGELSLSFSHWTQEEKDFTKDWRWWSAGDIARSTDEFFCDNLPGLLGLLAGGELPAAPVEI